MAKAGRVGRLLLGTEEVAKEERAATPEPVTPETALMEVLRSTDQAVAGVMAARRRMEPGEQEAPVVRRSISKGVKVVREVAEGLAGLGALEASPSKVMEETVAEVGRATSQALVVTVAVPSDVLVA